MDYFQVEVKVPNLVRVWFLWLKHAQRNLQKILSEFERVYEDAHNGIFKLDEWHDSFVFGKILNQLTPLNKNFMIIQQAYTTKLLKQEAVDILINSILGNYFDHMKGARKTKGKSQRKDLISVAESYWNEV